jgi:hypothetical protein
VSFKDDYSGYRIPYCTKRKAIENFKKMQRQSLRETRNQIMKFQSDCGDEFTRNAF